MVFAIFSEKSLLDSLHTAQKEKSKEVGTQGLPSAPEALDTAATFNGDHMVARRSCSPEWTIGWPPNVLLAKQIDKRWNV